MSQSGRFIAGTGAPPVETLTGNAGGPVPPDGAGNINILGGENATVTGNPGTNTLTIDVDGTVADTYTTNAGNAIPVAGVLNVLGTSGITTTGAGNTVTVTTNGTLATTYNADAGSATPALGVITFAGGTNIATSAAGSTVTINVDGTTDHAVQVGNAGAGLTSLALGVAGQILTSNGAGLDPSFQNAPAGGVTSITGDTGGAQTVAITLAGGTTGLSFGGAAGTITTTFAGITANGGTVNLGTDNAANAITIGTGTVARNINIGLSAAAHVINIGVNSGASSLGLNAGTGDMTLISGDAITLDASGVLELNSTGGAISVGNDANAQAINIGTGAAARTITMGNITGATALALNMGTGDFTLASATGTVISALDTGEITKPLQPAFLAYLASDDLNRTGAGASFTIGSGTALTEVFDQGGDFVTTGTFTAPVTGRYDLHGAVIVAGCTIATTIVFNIATSNRTYQFAHTRAASNLNLQAQIHSLCDMDSADTATITVATSGEAGNTNDIGGSATVFTFFSGYLAC